MKFLLDANLSPKVGKFLSNHLSLDVATLQGRRLGQLPDHEVARLARSEQRVIITLDSDFADAFRRNELPDIGIVFLDLPNHLRTIGGICQKLEHLFNEHGSQTDFESSLVILTELETSIIAR